MKHLERHSVLGTTYLIELKSIKDDTSENFAFRLFTGIRLFEFEFFISKAMGLNGISPKILFEDTKQKFGSRKISKKIYF